jgi:hypothetical protein
LTREPRVKWRWKRWIVGGSASLLLLIGTGAGWAYYQIYSIDISDIQSRQEAKQEGKPAEESVPSILNDSVNVANQHASKPVETQDALDVAAILLKSGLSLKEIYFLTGQATEQLTTEEKQKIRDLLLAKLTPEEIRALRSITKDYGKHLVILDPRYPIELVGVYDEAERQKILKDIEERKQGEGSSGITAAAPKPVPATIPKPTSVPNVQHVEPVPKDSSIPADPQKQEVQADLEGKYNQQMIQLKASCDSQVNQFVKEISAVLKENQEDNQQASLETLQKQFLPKIMQAEQSCDQKFRGILESAKKEYQSTGIESKDLNKWQEQYDKYKSEMRTKALAQISSASQ